MSASAETSASTLLRPPLAVHLYVTPRCNLSCPHCYYDAFERTRHPTTLITLEQIEAVLVGLVDRFEADIHLEGGEPFIRRGIDRLLDDLEPRILNAVTVTTNGTVPLRSTSAALRQLDILRISVDGHTQELQHEMRGANLDRVVRTCDELAKRDVPFMVRMTLWRKNIEALDAIYAWVACHGIRQLSLYEFQPSGRGREVDARFGVSDAEITAFLAALAGTPPPPCLERLTLHLAAPRIAALRAAEPTLAQGGFRVRPLDAVANCTINYEGSVGISPWRVTAQGAPDVFTSIGAPDFWDVLAEATVAGDLVDESPCISRGIVELVS